mmetsp:Transcript_144033/g.460997  ORF Transcript_144033/g.460997 Transcript_144033/m.460997 type:complete len:227 (-) Transcript_144033:1407-2087(-)
MEDVDQLEMIPPLLGVEGGTDRLQECAEGLQSLLAAVGDHFRADAVDDARGEHLRAQELPHKFHVAEHLGLVLHLGLKLLVSLEFLQVCGRLQVPLEGVLALVGQDPLEIDGLALLATDASIVQPLVQLHAEVCVHRDEVVLRGGLVEDLPHERLDVLLGLDAALQQLLVECVKLLDRQLVQDGLHLPRDGDVVVLLGGLLRRAPRVLGLLEPRRRPPLPVLLLSP